MYRLIVALFLISIANVTQACDETHNPWGNQPAFSPPDYSCQPTHHAPEPGTLVLFGIAAIAAKWKLRKKP